MAAQLSARKHSAVRHPLIARYSLAQLTIIAIIVYLWLSFSSGWYFDWLLFFTLFGIVACANLNVIIAAYRHWSIIGVRRQLLVLDWAAAWVWYGIFAPFYQLLTLTLSSEQLKIDAITYLWETSLLGAIAYLFTQYELTGLVKYAQSGSTPDPMRLYRQLNSFPVRAMIRNSVFSVAGYALAAWQMQWLAGLPSIEVYKNIGIGVILSFYVSMFYYLVYGAYLGPYKSRLISQYKLQNAIKSRFSQNAMAVMGLITLGSISLMALVYVQSMQVGIEQNIRRQILPELASITSATQAGAVNSFDEHLVGKLGSVTLHDVGFTDITTAISESTRTALAQQSEGIIRDNFQDPKLVVFKDLPDGRVIAIIHLNEHYDVLNNTYQIMIGGAVFILVIAWVVMMLFSRTLNQALGRLRVAVERAQASGTYEDPKIETGDEFELLSRAFEHFVEQTRQQNRQLAFEHARLKASVEGLQQGFVLVDAAGAILQWNTAAATILFDRPQDAPASLDSLADALPQTQSVVTSIQRHIKRAKHAKISKAQLGGKYLDIFVTPITSGASALGAAIMIVDSTDSELLDRSKDEFFSIASHELRTPLTVIRGNTSMMLDNYTSVLARQPELREMVGDMHEASIGLIEIVDDFLDVSRLEQGKMVFKLAPVDMADTTRKVVGELEGLATAKGLRLEMNVPEHLPLIQADPLRLRQVLYNLIGNAIKYTDSGSVQVAAHPQGQQVEVLITDTGRGVPADNQRLLFRKFQQANNNLFTRDTTRGTGLGLYISRLIAEKMSGKIYLVSSKVNHGSVFGFSMPQVKKSRRTK